MKLDIDTTTNYTGWLRRAKKRNNDDDFDNDLNMQPICAYISFHFTKFILNAEREKMAKKKLYLQKIFVCALCIRYLSVCLCVCLRFRGIQQIYIYHQITTHPMCAHDLCWSSSRKSVIAFHFIWFLTIKLCSEIAWSAYPTNENLFDFLLTCSTDACVCEFVNVEHDDTQRGRETERDSSTDGGKINNKIWLKQTWWSI